MANLGLQSLFLVFPTTDVSEVINEPICQSDRRDP